MAGTGEGCWFAGFDGGHWGGLLVCRVGPWPELYRL